MDLILTSKFPEGGTGKAHGGTLQVKSPEGQQLDLKIVVKLSFNKEQKARLQNEHRIYEHLAEKRGEGVADMFGLFEDVEEGVLALVLTHEGVSLSHAKEISPNQR